MNDFCQSSIFLTHIWTPYLYLYFSNVIRYSFIKFNLLFNIVYEGADGDEHWMATVLFTLCISLLLIQYCDLNTD